MSRGTSRAGYRCLGGEKGGGGLVIDAASPSNGVKAEGEYCSAGGPGKLGHWITRHEKKGDGMGASAERTGIEADEVLSGRRYHGRHVTERRPKWKGIPSEHGY